MREAPVCSVGPPAWLSQGSPQHQPACLWLRRCSSHAITVRMLPALLPACLLACRMVRDMQSRTVSEHSEALAASNAAIVRHAARALIQGCDTLELMHATRRGSHGSGHDQAHRISALLCFDEMQVGGGEWVRRVGGYGVGARILGSTCLSSLPLRLPPLPPTPWATLNRSLTCFLRLPSRACLRR